MSVFYIAVADRRRGDDARESRAEQSDVRGPEPVPPCAIWFVLSHGPDLRAPMSPLRGNRLEQSTVGHDICRSRTGDTIHLLEASYAPASFVCHRRGGRPRRGML